MDLLEWMRRGCAGDLEIHVARAGGADDAGDADWGERAERANAAG